MTGILIFGFVAALGYLVWVRLHSLMTYFQQEEYDDTRFVGAIKSVRLYDVKASVIVICAAVAGWVLGAGWILPLVGGVAIAMIARFEARYVYKKPLAKTQRAMRILRISAGVLAVVSVVCLWWPVWAAVVLQLAPVVIMAVNRALVPFQDRINQSYIDEARAKLARMDPVRIGITGSFGKTTVKHILAELLEASGPVFYSRGSINTELGLTRHIRQRLQWSHRYFIAEMGAYGIGSIARLCGFVNPNFGLITAVGDAHTERFGSIDAIAIAKAELGVDVCARGGRVVINHALLVHAPFANLKHDFPDQVVTVGRDPEADICVTSAEMVGGNWQIALKGQGLDIRYDLPLLGDHNVLNSALAVAMVFVIDLEAMETLPRITPNVQQIPHRLQKRDHVGQGLVLDDAYNSNETGFRNAVSVLNTLARDRGGAAILVTPGIAELGPAHDAVHASLGAYCAEHCDKVFVINPERIPTFVDAMRDGPVVVSEVASLAAARSALADTAPEDVILYENDLPDLLETTRLL